MSRPVLVHQPEEKNCCGGCNCDYKKNAYRENYAVPDKGCRTQKYRIKGIKIRSPKRRRSCHRSSSHHQSARNDGEVDEAFFAMRQRASNFLDSDSETPSSDNCSCCLCKPDSEVAKKAQGIDYSPESSFLKNLKKRSQVIQTLVGECDCCHCSKTFTAVTTTASECDTNDEVKPCPCSCEGPCCSKPEENDPCVEDEYAFLNKPRPKRRKTRSKRRRSKSVRASPSPGIRRTPMSPPRRSPRGSIPRRSRPKQRTTAARTRRPSRTSRTSRTSSALLGNLPRYASPPRSPVNKPDQRYDPNYRRAHGAGDSRETKVKELFMSPPYDYQPGYGIGGKIKPSSAREQRTSSNTPKLRPASSPGKATMMRNQSYPGDAPRRSPPRSATRFKPSTPGPGRQRRQSTSTPYRSPPRQPANSPYRGQTYVPLGPSPRRASSAGFRGSPDPDYRRYAPVFDSRARVSSPGPNYGRGSGFSYGLGDTPKYSSWSPVGEPCSCANYPSKPVLQARSSVAGICGCSSGHPVKEVSRSSNVGRPCGCPKSIKPSDTTCRCRKGHLIRRKYVVNDRLFPEEVPSTNQSRRGSKTSAKVSTSVAVACSCKDFGKDKSSEQSLSKHRGKGGKKKSTDCNCSRSNVAKGKNGEPLSPDSKENRPPNGKCTKKIVPFRGDSMALNFQKGMEDRYTKVTSPRVVYF